MRAHGDTVASREAGPTAKVAHNRGAVPNPDDDLRVALAVADAVLLEGYLLYPYRRSAAKNASEVRWQFGVLLPQAWARAHALLDEGVAGSAESWWQQTECLMEPAAAEHLRVRLRFLQVQSRSLEERGHRPVPELLVGDRLEVAFDEAVPRDVDVELPMEALTGPECPVEFVVPGGEDVERVLDADGRVAGRLVRRRMPVAVRMSVRAEPCATAFPLLRIRIRVENAGVDTDPSATRDAALRSALIATHVVVQAPPAGRFISLLDPPQWAAEAARTCRNVHVFPVLAGGAAGDDVVLSSPIILDDHPRIAPESPGDLHDAGEIDEILTLRTLTLTDEEKREARATDPRAAAILDRVDGLPPEVMARLHGAVRSLRPAGPPPVVVSGVHLGKGSRVLLRPRRRGTDAHDMFLEGRAAQVQEVLLDVDGSAFLAVTVDDDPGAELHQWYGRLRHFRPDEVVPLPDSPSGEGP